LLIVIKWHGAYLVRDGKIVDKYSFPESEIVNILELLSEGNFESVQEFISKYPEEELKFDGSVPDENLRKLAIELARHKMGSTMGDDYILMQSLAGYDDIVSSINLLTERLIEISRIEEIKGVELEEGIAIRNAVKELASTRDILAKRIENSATKLAPNLSHVVGPVIAARLMHYAGGLQRLARLPASTIQVLGAEDKFFQHLKKGTPCPKHGIIFQVPEIRNSPKKMRGKIARALAGKLAIAARVDYYGGEFIGEKLKDEFNARVEEIKNDTCRQGR